MKSIELSIIFKLVIKPGCTLAKTELQGEGKKLKPIRYGPFKVLDKIGENAFRLDLPTYMHIYSVVNA